MKIQQQWWKSSKVYIGDSYFLVNKYLNNEYEKYYKYESKNEVE